MKHHHIPSNFIQTPVFADEYVFGDNNLGGTVLDRDWREFTPRFEDQFKNGVESMSCATYGTLNAVEILFEAQFGVPDEDYSERYTSTLAGTTRQGNSPHKVGETVRKYGLVQEGQLPFDENVETWEDYFAPIPTNLKSSGKNWLKSWKFGHDWVITNNTRKEEKNNRIQDALRFSPIGVSVYGWADDNGVYIKAGGDNHWCLLLYGDRDYWYILDTYAPYIKRLEKNYDFGFAKRYTLAKRPRNWLLELLGI